MDLTGLEVSVDGSQLAVRFDVGDGVPEALDPLHTTVDSSSTSTPTATASRTTTSQIDSQDGWQATLFDYDTVFETELGPALVGDGSLGVVVLLSELGFPSDMRFQGLMSGLDFPDPVDDPLIFTEWEDRVPDGLDEWRALGESDTVPEDEERGPRRAGHRSSCVVPTRQDQRMRHVRRGRARMPGHHPPHLGGDHAIGAALADPGDHASRCGRPSRRSAGHRHGPGSGDAPSDQRA